MIGEIKYRDHDGALCSGVVWSPGPVASTVWVLPESGARSADAVVVHLPLERRADRKYQVDERKFELHQVEHVASTRAAIVHHHGGIVGHGPAAAQPERLAAQRAEKLAAKAWLPLTLDHQEDSTT